MNGKFSQHLGKGAEVEIDGEVFVLKPLTTADIPLFFKVMKAFSGAKEGAEIEDVLKNINDDGLRAVQEMIDKTLTKSYPNEPEEERKEFGLKYMNELIAKIFEINSNTMAKK